MFPAFDLSMIGDGESGLIFGFGGGGHSKLLKYLVRNRLAQMYSHIIGVTPTPTASRDREMHKILAPYFQSASQPIDPQKHSIEFLSQSNQIPLPIDHEKKQLWLIDEFRGPETTTPPSSLAVRWEIALSLTTFTLALPNLRWIFLSSNQDFHLLQEHFFVRFPSHHPMREALIDDFRQMFKEATKDHHFLVIDWQTSQLYRFQIPLS